MTDTTASGRLAGRTALITGASRGIGRAIAQAFAAAGADLFLTATNLAKLDETRHLLAAEPVEVHCHTADVGDPDDVEALFGAAVEWRGGIDILVNNAGIYIGKPFVNYDLSDLDRVMKVNVRALFQLTQLAIRHMLERGGGDGGGGDGGGVKKGGRERSSTSRPPPASGKVPTRPSTTSPSTRWSA